MGSTKFDVAIVGGGVLGSFHAFHALNKGLKVLQLERHTLAKGATTQNFGQVVPSGMNTKWQAFGRRSLAFYIQIQSQLDISVVNNGSIYIASDNEELELIEELAEVNKANDYQSELLTKYECLKKYPSLRSDYVKGGLYFPQELSINPQLMIHRFKAYLETFANYTSIIDAQVIEMNDDGVEVRFRDSLNREFRSEKVIICSGTEFKTLYPELFNRSDIELVKLQMMRLSGNDQPLLPGNILTGLSVRRYEAFSECPSYVEVKAKEDKAALWKKWGVHILFKQEADGSIIFGDSHEYADVGNADQLDDRIGQDINNYMILEGQKIMELANWQVTSQWNGFYAQCKSQDIFNHDVSNNIKIVTGIGGKGMTGGPGYSEMVIADL